MDGHLRLLMSCQRARPRFKARHKAFLATGPDRSRQLSIRILGQSHAGGSAQVSSLYSTCDSGQDPARNIRLCREPAMTIYNCMHRYDLQESRGIGAAVSVNTLLSLIATRGNMTHKNIVGGVDRQTLMLERSCIYTDATPPPRTGSEIIIGTEEDD